MQPAEVSCFADIPLNFLLATSRRMHGSTMAMANLIFLSVAHQKGHLETEIFHIFCQILFAYVVWWQTIRYRRTFRLERRLDFASLTSHECWIYFRFEKDDMNGLDDAELFAQNSSFSGQEAFLILLWRLSYSCRWSAGVPLLGRSSSASSASWQ